MNISAVNNVKRGIYLYIDFSNNIFSNLASAHNGDNGVRSIKADNNIFSGLLKVGNNGSGPIDDCYEAGGINPGIDNDCNSGATLTTGISLGASFVGKAGSDSVNLHGATGTELYDNITDWTTFENEYRGWGKEHANNFPSPNHRGPCVSGETCRIWDWSMSTADSGIIRNVIASIPTGNNTLTHTWSDASTTTFLRNAVEIMEDGIGNENLLCESNETCLFTPNIGSYQGHGNLISAGSFTNGTLTGIILLKYEFNGR